MILFLFSIALLLGCLLSELAGRTIISLSVFFLVVGISVSLGHLVQIGPTDPLVMILAETALVSILFVDAAKIDRTTLISSWKLPGRALLLGMPISLLGTAWAAHALAGLGWQEAFLVGAVLSPTDPVFVSALINSERIPYRLKHLLNVESGVNDGLAFPLVLVFLGQILSTEISPETMALELVEGVAIGAITVWLVLKAIRTRYFTAHHSYLPLLGFALILTVYSLSKQIHANVFLAAFSAGLALAAVEEPFKKKIFQLIEPLGELLKLAAIMVFGCLLSFHLWKEFRPGEIVFVLVAVVVVRPIALSISLISSDLGWKERLVAGWFGPKGFASIVFGLLLLSSRLDHKWHLFHLIALVVCLSIVLLSTTDLIAERWLSKEMENPEC